MEEKVKWIPIKLRNPEHPSLREYAEAVERGRKILAKQKRRSKTSKKTANKPNHDK